VLSASEPSLDPPSIPVFRFEPWVRDAVDRGVPESQLELHFQPIVRLDGSGVYGAETFLRWRHPERGVLRAGQWLPYAIRSGAAVALSAAVLPAWAACARGLPGLVLSFNVTGWDLVDERYVASMLAVGAGGASGLALEVPYLQFHPDVAKASAPDWGWLELADLDAGLAEFQALGFSVWLDDFGCENTDDETAALGSSVDVVKLDMSLLGWERGRLTGLIDRLHDHDKVVLIEGVESDAHERFAVETGVDLASGYRYAPPLTEQQFARYLDA
jgi:EAL domain-containing protein (putative c-di-GMP-specific phosphodiesterase class I)